MSNQWDMKHKWTPAAYWFVCCFSIYPQGCQRGDRGVTGRITLQYGLVHLMNRQSAKNNEFTIKRNITNIDIHLTFKAISSYNNLFNSKCLNKFIRLVLHDLLWDFFFFTAKYNFFYFDSFNFNSRTSFLKVKLFVLCHMILVQQWFHRRCREGCRPTCHGWWSWFIETSQCVSEIPCIDCSLTYIGETGRHFGKRMEEYKRYLQGVLKTSKFTRAEQTRSQSVYSKSAITDHFMQENHGINWDGAKIKDQEAHWKTK